MRKHTWEFHIWHHKNPARAGSRNRYARVKTPWTKENKLSSPKRGEWYFRRTAYCEMRMKLNDGTQLTVFNSTSCVMMQRKVGDVTLDNSYNTEMLWWRQPPIFKRLSTSAVRTLHTFRYRNPRKRPCGPKLSWLNWLWHKNSRN